MKTITEALAELKVIDKKIEKKREFIRAHLTRQEQMRDPLEKDGGQAAAIAVEEQAIGDLLERKVRIRLEIARANDVNYITIGSTSRSIAEWLIWRREAAPTLREHLASLTEQVNFARTDAKRRGGALVQPGETGKLTDVVVNIGEREFAARVEALEEVLGTLDGLLSLKNATIQVDV